jgi:four helix bundle protein
MEHNKLDVYKLALEFVLRADQVTKDCPRGRGELSDQLKRASFSIPLNIAEGAGEYSPKDKAKFYRYAKRSTAECAAVLDVAKKLDEAVDLHGMQEMAEHLTALLTNLIKRCET